MLVYRRDIKNNEMKQNSLEEGLEHVIRHLLRPGAVDLVDLLGVRVVRVESSELTFDVAKQKKEMRTIAPVDHILWKKCRVSWQFNIS